MTAEAERRYKVTVALALVYLLWGTSYLATKIMVSAQPPLLSGGVRFVLAGVVLGLVALWRGERPPRAAVEWRTVGLCALLNVVVSNGSGVLGMQHVASNVGALLNATPALWIALLGTFGPRPAHLSGSAKFGLAIGLVGVALILLPEGGLAPRSLPWQLLILLGCLGWSIGTIVYRNAGVRIPPMMFTALQMLAGGAAMLGLSRLAGEPLALDFTGRGVVAMLWLTFMSSCIAYTAYSWLIHHTTPVVVGTYGYVNPAIAAVAGWLVLGETLGWPQIAGMGIIFVAVALVTGYLSPLFERSAPPPSGEP